MAQPQQRPEKGLVRFYNFLPQGNLFLEEALQGMAQPRKSLPARYLYDVRGRELFENVCASPECHLGRAEIALMREHAGSMARFLGTDCQLIEFGAGSSNRTRILIEQLRPPLYVLVDIDGEAMKSTAGRLAQEFPWLNIIGVCADYTKALALPAFVGVPIRKKAVYFPGSDLGHFNPEAAIAVLSLARRMVGVGGALLAGIDGCMDKKQIDAAGNDAAGATAALNLHLLERINRELGGDFQLRRFGHRAAYDEKKNRIEMHIESLAEQLVHLSGVRLRLRQGEVIATAISCKYSIEQFQAVAHRAGFEPDQTWSGAGEQFSMHGMIAV